MPYEIQTKDGITIRNIPDDIPPDAQVLKDRVAKIRAERDGVAQPQQPAQQSGVLQSMLSRGLGTSVAGAPSGMAQALQTPEARDPITGEVRATEETRTLPEWTGMPELNTASMASFKSGVGTMFASPDEAVKVIQANFPGTQVRQDAKGNYILKSSIDGQEYAIPPGFSVGDIPRAIGAVAAGTPAARVGSLVGGGLAAGGTQAGIEATQAATGGEFNPEDVAMVAGLGAAGNLVADIPGAVQSVKTAAQQAVQNVPGRTAAQVLPEMRAPAAQGFGASTAGAAQTRAATARQAKAAELPEPIKLTTGQATRDFEQLRFERETAKDPEIGGPIRQRLAEQNEKLAQNLDAFVDMTGGTVGETDFRRFIGVNVDKALRDRAARDKVKIRALYKQAENAGEMQQPAVLPELSKFLTENAPEAEVANVLKLAKNKALQLGLIAEDAAGNLVSQPATLKNIELFRRSINQGTNAEPTNIRFAQIIKGILDDGTEDVGGDLYKRARSARAQYAQDYENIGLVKNLIGTKRGTTDRAVAYEDVLDNVILSPATSLDSVRRVRALLQTAGEDGKQAWRELQAGTLQNIREQAFGNIARDEAGNRILSPAKFNKAITDLDKAGKLDFVFGRKGAEMLRIMNDVAQDALTVPPGSVNTSNTATVLAGMIDLATTSMTGVPAPVASGLRYAAKQSKNRKLRARVEAALKGIEEK